MKFPAHQTLLLLFLGASPGSLSSGGESEWKTSRPITYCIDYQAGHVGNRDYLKKISAAPPDLLHVGEDIPFSRVYGTKDGYAGDKFKLLSAAELHPKIADVSTYVDSLHRSGVRWVIPYINNKALFGDHVRRTGFWQVYDQWEQYAEFGFGPRPPEDPVLAQVQYPFRTIRISKPEDPHYPRKLYQMCINHPTWRQYLLAMTANVAKCGYDGTFVDEMDCRDYCNYDEAAFRQYVRKRFDAVERRRRYGTSDVESLRLGYPGQGALWHDTQEFWAESNAELLTAIRDEGRKYRPDFFVVPNYGPYSHFDGLNRRITSGKDPARWARASRMIMFEEWHRPGQLGENVFIDFRLQYKIAYALRFQAGLLSYLAQEAAGIELSMAEAGAGGGGALIQPYYNAPESRRKFGRFFKDRSDLFEGYESNADVGVLFQYDQLYWGNVTHSQNIYRLAEYLSNQHILYDLLPPSEATPARLSRYKAVITPSLRYLSDTVLSGLRAYTAAGGTWLDVGKSGQFDEAGHLRLRTVRPAASERMGKGHILRRDDLAELIEYHPFALYLLNEDQNNSLKETRAVMEAALAGEIPVRTARPREDLRLLLEALARKFHTPPAATRDRAAPTSLRSLTVLDVPVKYACAR